MKDLHELIWKSAELLYSKYSKNGDISVVEIPIKENRKQIVYTKLKIIDGEKYALVFSKIGRTPENVDIVKLLKINYFLNYSKIAITPDNLLCVLATFPVETATPFETSKIIKEVAKIADDVEEDILKLDLS